MLYFFFAWGAVDFLKTSPDATPPWGQHSVTVANKEIPLMNPCRHLARKGTRKSPKVSNYPFRKGLWCCSPQEKIFQNRLCYQLHHKQLENKKENTVEILSVIVHVHLGRIPFVAPTNERQFLSGKKQGLFCKELGTKSTCIIFQLNELCETASVAHRHFGEIELGTDWGW